MVALRYGMRDYRRNLVLWVLLDGAFTPSFDEFGALALALAWLVGVTAVAAARFHRLASPKTGMTGMAAFGLRPTSAKTIHYTLSLSCK